MNTPVRCSYAGCSLLGEHFEADGRWWFCSGHYLEHLAIRREEMGDRPERIRKVREQRTAAVRQELRELHAQGLNDEQTAVQLRLPAGQVREHRRALGLPANGMKKAQCGTRSGYVSHRNRGETACPACAQAQRDYDNARKRPRKRTA